MDIVLTLIPINESSHIVSKDNQFHGILLFITLVFSSIHLFSYHLQHLFKRHQQFITSFSAGLAVTYVFLHLLPSLEKSEKVFGKSIHLVTLLGFIIFYGINSLILQNSIKSESSKHHIFQCEVLFLAIYNTLIILTLPEYLVVSASDTILYLLAMGSHLLLSNYKLKEKYHYQSYKIGCYILVFSLFLGLFISFISGFMVSTLISNMLTAILAGFILFNVFVEELPHPQYSKYFYFVVGVMFYVFLLKEQI